MTTEHVSADFHAKSGVSVKDCMIRIHLLQSTTIRILHKIETIGSGSGESAVEDGVALIIF